MLLGNSQGCHGSQKDVLAGSSGGFAVGRHDKQLALPLLVPGLYTTIKSNCCRSNIHQLTRPSKSFTVFSDTRGLWSVYKWNGNP